MPDMLNIMQLCGAPDAGGAQLFFLRLTRALHHHSGVNVLPVVRSGSWLAQRLAEETIPFRHLTFGGGLDMFTRPRLKALIHQFKPHVAQSWMNRASRFLPRGMTCGVGRLGGYYDLKYYEGLDHLIGNTPDICRYLREQGWPPERVHYIPNFVDLPPEGFRREAGAMRARYGIPPEAAVLLTAARLHPVKGIDTLLEALAQLPPHVHALIAGSGDEEPALRKRASALDIAPRAHFAGWVNNITPLCAAANIFVVPSRSEPLGNVVLEAWAHAVPLVSTASEGPTQLVKPRKNGLLVPIDDATGMAAAIEEILHNPNLAASLAEGGLQTLQSTFSEEAVLRQYLDFYRRAKDRTLAEAAL